jgi:hypothetical protein
MSDKPVRQVCPTWDQTILSDAMSNKPGSMGLSDMGSDNCVRSRVEQAGSMSFSDMGSNNLSQQGNDLLVKELGEQANNLLAKS